MGLIRLFVCVGRSDDAAALFESGDLPIVVQRRLVRCAAMASLVHQQGNTDAVDGLWALLRSRTADDLFEERVAAVVRKIRGNLSGGVRGEDQHAIGQERVDGDVTAPAPPANPIIQGNQISGGEDAAWEEEPAALRIWPPYTA